MADTLDEIIALNVQRQLEAFRTEDALRLADEVDRQVAAFCAEHDRQCMATRARMAQLEAVYLAAKDLIDSGFVFDSLANAVRRVGDTTP
jgi:hypothetical protein